jgi:protein-tyrosine kinase
MTVERAEQGTWDISEELRDELITFVPLSQPDVVKILERMRESSLNFCDAALQLQLVTEEDIKEISGKLRSRQPGGRQGGVIEAAIRRASERRDVTVRQGEARLSTQLRHVLDADDPRSEKIRALRTELMLLGDSTQRGNVLALVGPDRRDGRSQLCAELAVSFAQLGRRTLLLDADLRHPHQHVLFNTDSQWGLSQNLAHGEPLFLHTVEHIPALSLLTCGTLLPNPLELVSHRRFRSLITEMRRQYEFVVIDTPAVSPYADALQIANVTQHVLVVSRANTTSFAGMKDMLRRLAVTNTKILGAVINRF